MLFCSSSYNYRKDLKDPSAQVVNITGLGGQHHQNKKRTLGKVKIILKTAILAGRYEN